MYACFLQIFLEDYISPRQHAYQPGKGCVSAWKDLAKKMENYKYVYEIDLKGCFDNIQLDNVLNILEKLGMPKRTLYHIENINLSIPEFPKEKLLDESILEDKAEMQARARGLGLQKNLTQPTSLTQVYDEMPPEDQKVVMEIAKEEGINDIEEFIQMQ